MCHDVTFKSNGCIYASSGGSFHLQGYGTLPKSCSATATSKCTVKLCGQTHVKVTAKTSDRWVFDVIVGNKQLTPKHKCGKDYGVTKDCCGGTGMETDQWTHVSEEWKLPASSKACKKVQFMTNGCRYASSGGPFYLEGYGTLPRSCSSSSRASCTVNLCNEHTVKVTAKTSDRWVFNVVVDGKKMTPKNKCGTHYGVARDCCGGTGMETDQWTHVNEQWKF